MRLTFSEIDALLGLIGNADRHAMAEEFTNGKEAQQWLDTCERAEEKLTRRYWQLKDRA